MGCVSYMRCSVQRVIGYITHTCMVGRGSDQIMWIMYVCGCVWMYMCVGDCGRIDVCTPGMWVHRGCVLGVHVL